MCFNILTEITSTANIISVECNCMCTMKFSTVCLPNSQYMQNNCFTECSFLIIKFGFMLDADVKFEISLSADMKTYTVYNFLLWDQ